MAIPRTIHVIWLGAKLPALAWLAVRAALARAGAERVVLRTDAPALANDPLVRNLMTCPNFSLDATPPDPDGLPTHVQTTLQRLAQRLRQPAARSDLLRLQWLWQHGGLYIDADAIALQSFAPLWPLDGVAGLEHVCLPAKVVHSRSPLTWARAGALMGLREAIRRTAHPATHFRLVDQLFDVACNNAVLGFAPQSPVLLRLLERIAALPLAQATALYELGPRLLEAETQNTSIAGLTLLQPAVFYPLAPEICGALLRPRPSSQPLLPEPQSLLVHLYDSVLARQLGQPLDAQWLLHAGRKSWLAELVEPFLPDLAQLAEA